MSKFIQTKEVEELYQKMRRIIEKIKAQSGTPLTLTEKILFTHLYDEEKDYSKIKRGETELELAPDRVAMQDATAQMAILQFISVGVSKVAISTSIHCDHLIKADRGAISDLAKAKILNKEVYDFLGSATEKYGMDFWEPGSGIIHQIILENYAYPGSMIIGTDSHTSTAGGLGQIAIGVGGADVVDTMTAQSWALKMPKIMGIKLTGKLNGWASAKDVILYLCGRLSAKGATGNILEYFGEGVESLSTTGKATITNMGAELGATTSIFPYDKRMSEYLKATGRADIAELSDKYSDILKPDQEITKNYNKFFDEIIEIDLDEIEPALVGPHSPDLYHLISKINFKELGLPEKISVCLIGSCTNSSYEDISRAAGVVKMARAKGLQLQTPLLVSPGSNQIAITMKRDGFMEIFEEAGAIILSNSCGPCIGQWERSDSPKSGEKNIIISSFNRNFKKRNDGREETQAFLASPEIVVAMAFAGKLSFNPLTDTLINARGEEVALTVPEVDDLPTHGFAKTDLGVKSPAKDGSNLKVIVASNSERIQLLKPFNKWDLEKDFNDLLILVKTEGKCTTDHISPAGKWLKYRGHLDNISQNMYSGAINAFTKKIGEGKNILTGEMGEFQEIARDYLAKNQGWVVVGDENYGEGSSREHAAMEPRFLGCRAVICKSFARIAETNLKKQGILPLCFKNPADYNKIREDDRLDITDIIELSPEKDLVVQLKHSDGQIDELICEHTLSTKQIKWIKEGSALNLARKILCRRL